MNEPSLSITQALAWAIDQLSATSPTPRLDAELLLAHALGWPRARVLAEGRAPLVTPQWAAFRDLIARRAALEPVAYLIGHKEFFGLDFLVDHRVLVPRPETELLVELAIAFARRLTAKDRGSRIEDRGSRIEDRGSEPPLVVGRRSSVVVADIGVGSGAIAVAVAVHVPRALLYATDISPEALRVARMNVERHGVADRVRLLQGDLLDTLPEPVDLLLSNPPYTIVSEIDEGVRRHEPRLALDGGPDGLAVYRKLLAAAPPKLRPGGAILLEIGATQGAALVALARASFPTARVEVHQDLAGLDRVVEIAT